MLAQLDRTKNIGRRAEIEQALQAPELPLAGVYLWRIFCRLSGRRSSGGFAVNPIGWADIDAFMRRAQITLAPWEIDILESLDDLYRLEQAKKRD